MKKRCSDTKSPNYPYYGAKGVRVCARWQKDFLNFWKDMKDGYADHLQIERKNNRLGYFKSNCRWATQQEQKLNRTNTVWVKTPRGKMTLMNAVTAFGAPYSRLSQRARKGWTPELLVSPRTFPHSKLVPSLEGLLTIREASKKFAVSKGTLHRRIKRRAEPNTLFIRGYHGGRGYDSAVRGFTWIDTPKGRMRLVDASKVFKLRSNLILYRMEHGWPESEWFTPPDLCRPRKGKKTKRRSD